MKSVGRLHPDRLCQTNQTALCFLNYDNLTFFARKKLQKTKKFYCIKKNAIYTEIQEVQK